MWYRASLQIGWRALGIPQRCSVLKCCRIASLQFLLWVCRRCYLFCNIFCTACIARPQEQSRQDLFQTLRDSSWLSCPQFLVEERTHPLLYSLQCRIESFQSLRQLHLFSLSRLPRSGTAWLGRQVQATAWSSSRTLTLAGHLISSTFALMKPTSQALK